MAVQANKITFKGFLPGPNEEIEKILKTETTFENRDEVEVNPVFKQIVAYIVVTCKDKILVTVRNPNHTEKRLANKTSIGIGGHVNPDRNKDIASIMLSAYRELSEECKRIPDIVELIKIGYVNSEETEVDKVHLGIVYKLKVKDESQIEVNNTEHKEYKWLTVGEVYKSPNMETWTRLILESNYFGKIKVTPEEKEQYKKLLVKAVIQASINFMLVKRKLLELCHAENQGNKQGAYEDYDKLIEEEAKQYPEIMVELSRGIPLATLKKRPTVEYNGEKVERKSAEEMAHECLKKGIESITIRIEKDKVFVTLDTNNRGRTEEVPWDEGSLAPVFMAVSLAMQKSLKRFPF